MASAISFPSVISLQVHNGKYVCAEDIQALVPASETVGPAETFAVINYGNNKISLRARNGRYVSADEGGVLFANYSAVNIRGVFTAIDRGNDQMALQSYNGKYVRVEGSRALVTSSESVGAEETFTKGLAPFPTEPQADVVGDFFFIVKAALQLPLESTMFLLANPEKTVRFFSLMSQLNLPQEVRDELAKITPDQWGSVSAALAKDPIFVGQMEHIMRQPDPIAAVFNAQRQPPADLLLEQQENPVKKALETAGIAIGLIGAAGQVFFGAVTLTLGLVAALFTAAGPFGVPAAAFFAIVAALSAILTFVFTLISAFGTLLTSIAYFLPNAQGETGTDLEPPARPALAAWARNLPVPGSRGWVSGYAVRYQVAYETAGGKEIMGHWWAPMTGGKMADAEGYIGSDYACASLVDISCSKSYLIIARRIYRQFRGAPLKMVDRIANNVDTAWVDKDIDE